MALRILDLLLDDRGSGGDSAGDPTETGALRRVGDFLRLKAASAVEQILTVRNYAAGFAGLDLSGVTDGGLITYDDSSKTLIPGPAHEALDTLTHQLTETHNVVVSRDGNNKISSVLAEETGGTDIRKLEVLSRASGKVATYRETQYAANGTSIERQLDVTVNRSGGKVTSLNVVRTV